MSAEPLKRIPLHQSIRFKMVAGVLVLILPIVIVFAFFIQRQNQRYFEAGFVLDANALVNPFYAQLRGGLPTGPTPTELIQLSALTAGPIHWPGILNTHSDLLAVLFVDRSGQSLFAFGDQAIGAESLPNQTPKRQDETIVEIGENHATVAVPFFVDGQLHGQTILVFSSELYRGQHRDLLLTSIWLTIVAGLIGVLGAYNLGQRITKPIIRLADEMRDSGRRVSIEPWRKSGDEVTMLALRFQELQDEIGKHINDLNQEIVVRTLAESKIKQIALVDELTGLPNRACFNRELENAIKRADKAGAQIAVLFIDLDGFKNINDFHGHPFGDRLLSNLGVRLKERFNAMDTIARFGGDEFVAVVEASDSAILNDLLNDLISLCGKVRNIDDYEFALTASIGVCTYPGHGGSSTELLKNADIAMYQAKLNGGNEAVIFDQSMAVAVAENVRLRDDLIYAIENEEFELRYQPILDLASNTVVAAEALIRWQHPRRGTIFPDTFIEIAEQNGLITEIGSWVLKEACQQFERWRKLSIGLERICVNVSPKQFHDDRFYTMVEETIKSTGIDSTKIEFEMTENILISASSRSEELLKQLQELGLKIAIDDFGTGYSSLSYLRQFPINTLKIDRSFVNGCTTDASRMGILRAIVTMTKTLGVKSIAEGIESDADLAFVSAEGCDEGQGFLFSDPMTAQAFQDYVQCQHANRHQRVRWVSKP